MPPEGRPSVARRKSGRRIGAVALVVALLTLVASSPFLFGESPSSRTNAELSDGAREGDGDRGLGREPSIYSNIAFGAALCRPDAEAPTGGGGADSVPAIARTVERLRALEFADAPEVEFMSPAELAAYVEGLAREELDDVEADVQIAALGKLGIVPDDFDVEELIADTSGQVLGLYEPQTKRLLVAGSGTLDPLEQLTVAHELDHAVTDQVLGFPDLRWEGERSDAQLAERALIEGDATLLMQHFGMVEFADDLQELLAGDVSDEQIRDYQSLPHFLQRSLSFPYLEGYLFACELHATGGWDAIDRAYGDLPASTLEILYPGLYGKVDLQEPEPTPLPGRAWQRVYLSGVGAADLQWMFEAPGGTVSTTMADAARQVARWRGGRFEIWQRQDELVIAMAIVEGADLSRSDAPTLGHRWVQWYTESQPDATCLDGRGATGAWRVDGDVAIVACDSGQTRFVSAPNLRIALRVARL